ncbi:hypothetical protein AVEN_255091-1 [Araneus ventricosus]|uniref:Uncharacterized protein n=1 Tax=Araneus ventricosus TaxID=182803 RepID=A0A4Y2EH71_ARAVE|nr:hypothetical protein AVEN_255091-1 [Araneus ventricosus]
MDHAEIWASVVKFWDQRAPGSKHNTTKDPCFRARCRLHLTSRISPPEVGVMRKCRERVAGSGVVLVICTVQNYEIRLKIALVLLKNGTSI